MRAKVGFFTDSSICIGCKACEVACKEWNGNPVDGLAWSGNSYDNTGTLSADTWRHVQFVETRRDGATAWLMNSDVCKHCSDAACLEVCPTGAIFRTKFGTVVVQDDVCNGCGYCVAACPFGVIARREADGGAHKCTLCYDRLQFGEQPACARACPTESILYGPMADITARAERRLAELREAGVAEARLYGRDEDNGVGGTGAFFLLLDRPERYGLPSDPISPTRRAGEMWTTAAVAAGALALGVIGAVLSGRRR